MTDRIPCINPNCRRTGSREKMGDCQIVCAKCWRVLPKRLTARYRALARRDRNIDRRVKRFLIGVPVRPYQLSVLADQLDRLQRKNWSEIWRYFNAGEKPAGLDAFLEEQNL